MDGFATKFGRAVGAADVIICNNFFGDRLRRVDSVGGSKIALSHCQSQSPLTQAGATAQPVIKFSQVFFILKKMSPFRKVGDFHGLQVSQGKGRALSRWGGKLYHLSMAYVLTNTYIINYWNR